MGQYEWLEDEITRVLTPEEASKWPGLEQDWPTGGTAGHARALDDPAPNAAEVAAGRVLAAVARAERPRRETPEDHRQKARDAALARARQGQQLLEESVDWAGEAGAEEGAAMLEHVAGWVRTRANAAKPRNPERRVFDFDQEQPGPDRKEG